MSQYLSKEEVEQLRQHLIVPLAISDILKHDLDIAPDMHYGLHLALSEVDPDSALLAIALCAIDIGHKAGAISPIAMALQNEAQDILTDYARSWMRKNIHSPLPSHVYEEILETVPEDLESLADLLDALFMDIDDESNEMSVLTKLLSIQARAHMEIADYVLAEIAYEKNQTPNEKYSFMAHDEYEEGTNETASTGGDNIILFPGGRG